MISMRHFGIACATGVALGALCVASASATPATQQALVDLNDGQIRSAVSGRYVTDDHHWGHHYLPDGRVVRAEMGHIRPGRWAVKDKQLCLTMPGISTQPECFRVQRNGDELFYLDRRGHVVWQGLVRDRKGAHLFEGVVER